MPASQFFEFFIDTGGTFTDCIYLDPKGEMKVLKVLSTGVLRSGIEAVLSDSEVQLREGFPASVDIFSGFHLHLRGVKVGRVESYNLDTKVLRVSGTHFSKDHAGDLLEISAGEEAPVLAIRLATDTSLKEDFPPLKLRLATTRGTNALLEGKGADLTLIVTEGFKDLLEIGTQQREDLFSLDIMKTPPLVRRIVEVSERIDTGGKVLKKLDAERAVNLFREGVIPEDSAIAISLLNACASDIHERELRQIFKSSTAGDLELSTEVSPLMNYLNRTRTLCVNSFLSPVIGNYVISINNSLFPDRTDKRTAFFMMTSGGNLNPANNYKAVDSLLSGPASGVMGAMDVAREAGFSKIITFDMGGTSTDVSHYAGEPERKFELDIAGHRIQSPVIDIETVAAGGGSVCYYDRFSLKVGPESAGANPGPACYGAGGPLTLTDVNLLSGRIAPDWFQIPVFPEEAELRLEELIAEIEVATGRRREKEEVLSGFLRIANEAMAAAIKKISVARGHSLSDYALVTFGGAGGLHSCELAELLNMKSVLVHKLGGVLSAYGLCGAKLQRFSQIQLFELLDQVEARLPQLFEKLEKEALGKLRSELLDGSAEISERNIFLRYLGQDATVKVRYSSDCNISKEFAEQHRREFGFVLVDRKIEVESLKVLAGEIKKSNKSAGFGEGDHPSQVAVGKKHDQKNSDEPIRVPLGDLRSGDRIRGPALVMDHFSSVWISSGWRGHLVKPGYLTMERNPSDPAVVPNAGFLKSSIPDEVQLELYSNRFRYLAENMGAALERTAISVNVKERLDFSCALCDPEGYLVANAPHVPVHLGSLGTCVRSVLEVLKPGPGDVIITNHPAFGGSHLPDITLIKAVFDDEGEILGFVVNRAHHAEIGGISPGSMPMSATNLAEEGVVIEPFFLFEAGVGQWDKLESLLCESKWPSRKPRENIADVEAGIASLNRGEAELKKLHGENGRDELLSFMRMMRLNTGQLVKEQLKELKNGQYRAEELLDDGSPLRLCMDIRGESCTMDFYGSGNTHPGNLNATPAIVRSVVMYFLRLLLKRDVPLNEGILDPVDIRIPRGMLNPCFDSNAEKCPAVMGGNVEVSQRLTDLLLKTTGLMAASQGTMNNVVFGNARFGYYETIGGGTGAGPGFHGSDAVHHHMTNTRITDAEVLEKRFPVLLNRFEIRRESGGEGKFRGGNGIRRQFTFTENVHVSILAERRKSGPYGLDGGEDGKSGRQYVEKRNGEKIEVDGRSSFKLERGDSLTIETPGGGGYGKAD